MFAAHAALLTGVGLPPPTVTGISPTSFYTNRWVTFTITGTNFVPGATTASAAIASGGLFVNSVNSAGTSLDLSIMATSAGSSAVTITTPFGSASTQAISASVEPPPMSVSTAYRGFDFNYVFQSSSASVMVHGSGFTSSTQAYQNGAYRSTAFYGSTQLFFSSSGAAAGSFFLYDPNTGSGTGFINYS